eukprot:jgi/Phyca11/505491/fgenesh2_kg.PHYCAscaffold_13_\
MTVPPNRSLSSRPQRSRKGFAAGKSRLSLKIDAECTTNAVVTPVTENSTPASTSSSCGSDVVPWWEVEYQCPPPGHLGAHVVPVSADEQTEQLTVTKDTANSTTRSSSDQEINAIRTGLVMYETPERARRGPHNKLTAIRSSLPCLLVDSSPSQKRKMRPQDPTDCEADLFSTPVTKVKRFHETSANGLKKSVLPSRVVTPSTLVQPLTQIGISETIRLKPRTEARVSSATAEKPQDEAP